MGVLDAVIAQKQQEAQAIPNAVDIFLKAKQMAAQNRFEQLRLNADLATKGIKMNTDGSFSIDDSLKSATDKLLEKGAIAKAQMNIYEAGGPAPDLFGNGQSQVQQNPIQPIQNINAQTTNTDQPDIQPTAYDQFGRPKEFKDINLDAIQNKKKNEVELNRKQSVLLRVGKRIYDVWKTTEPSEIRTAQVASIPGSFLQGTPGQKKDSVYRDFVNSLKSQMARGQGEVGNLSAPEQAATLGAVPSLGDVKSVGYDKLVNYFTNIREVTTDPESKKEAQAMIDKLQSEYSSDQNNSKDTITNPLARAGTLIEKSLADTLLFPLGGAEGILKDANQLIPPSQAQEQRQSEIINIKPKNDFEYLLSLGAAFKGGDALLKGVMGSARLGAAAAKGEQIMQQTAPAAANAGETAQSVLTKIKGDGVINAVVKDAQQKIKSGFISDEHNAYANTLGKIKGSKVPIKGADAMINKFMETNYDSTLGKFKTPTIEKVYNAMSNKLSSSQKITEDDLVKYIKELKGDFKKGPIDYTKSTNLKAASDLTNNLSEGNLKLLKNANIKYSAFKKAENDINDLINIYNPSSKNIDNVVNRLLTKDLGIEQGNVAKLIGDKTGLDLLNSVNYYRGLNQTIDATWIARQISNLSSGGVKMIKSIGAKKPNVK